MKNYLDLVQDVLANGIEREDRTGVGSKSVFGRTLRWDLGKGFPIITTRKVAFRIAFEETMFFLRGETDTTILEHKNINIWKGNTSREFLDKQGLTELPVGSIGKGYSHQWRNFGGDLNQSNGVDQIRELVSSLINDPNGRRHIVSAWNPVQLHETPLPPCHLYHQYQILDGKLNSSFVMRSNDVIYGLPYNIMGYAFINIVLSKMLGLQPGELVYFGNDVHIYNNQLEIAAEQVTRTPDSALPELNIYKDLDSLDDILDLQFDDVELVGYNPQPDFRNKPPMAK